MYGMVSLVRMLIVSFLEGHDDKERIIVLSEDRELSLSKKCPARKEESGLHEPLPVKQDK